MFVNLNMAITSVLINGNTLYYTCMRKDEKLSAILITMHKVNTTKGEPFNTVKGEPRKKHCKGEP